MAPHRLKVDRVRLGVPQYRLAAALGITQSALCSWENGRRPITPEQERAVRDVLQSLAGDRLPPKREIPRAVA
jgi:transcriptional regulator with XRE-family HTH domain